MKIRVYLDNGQVITLKGVEDFTLLNGAVRWKVKTSSWKPVYLDPDKIVAVTRK